MARLDFIHDMHRGTKRDYRARVLEHDKAECAAVAKRFGRDYWDGDRKYGYGGYRYDGRWRPVAEHLARHFQLRAGERLLDIGCGKGYLLYEFTQVVPGLQVYGLDISEYAIRHGKPELGGRLMVADAYRLPFRDASFDAVVTLGTLHNLAIERLLPAVREIRRVARGSRNYFMVESFRDEAERANLLYWQLTCESFFSPESWAWVLDQAGYRGDHGFIYFE
jgi:SAM-dependent methyltransferase